MAPQNRFAFFRGKIVPIEEARVSIMTSAFNYGTGLFEGIRAYWNKDRKQLYVFRLREHFERFLRNCRPLMIELPYTTDRLIEITLDLLRREAYETDTYVRPLAYKSSEILGVRLHDLEADCALFAVPFGEYMEHPEGAKLGVSSWRRLDDNALPPRGKFTGAYINSALIKTEAHLNGFDDGIVLCENGHVCEASAANLFIVRKGRIFTPPVTDNILEGITRDSLMQMLREEGIETVERSIDRTELYMADEVFICGTAVNVSTVIEVDHRKVGNGKSGPIGLKLREAYYAVARGETDRHPEWRTPVYEKK
jgi:branched-chain amino acid aminotransferase